MIFNNPDLYRKNFSRFIGKIEELSDLERYNEEWIREMVLRYKSWRRLETNYARVDWEYGL